MSTEVSSPVGGLAAPLSEVPDPVFSQAMVGPGVAVKPHPGWADAVAPVAGSVATLHPHAFVITADSGVSVLVHLGIDTVKLQGEGFALRVAQGERVALGQPIVGWDPANAEASGYSSVCPVVALDVPADGLGDLADDGAVVAGDALFVVT